MNMYKKLSLIVLSCMSLSMESSFKAGLKTVGRAGFALSNGYAAIKSFEASLEERDNMTLETILFQTNRFDDLLIERGVFTKDTLPPIISGDKNATYQNFIEIEDDATNLTVFHESSHWKNNDIANELQLRAMIHLIKGGVWASKTPLKLIAPIYVLSNAAIFAKKNHAEYCADAFANECAMVQELFKGYFNFSKMNSEIKEFLESDDTETFKTIFSDNLAPFAQKANSAFKQLLIMFDEHPRNEVRMQKIIDEIKKKATKKDLLWIEKQQEEYSQMRLRLLFKIISDKDLSKEEKVSLLNKIDAHKKDIDDLCSQVLGDLEK